MAERLVHSKIKVVYIISYIDKAVAFEWIARELSRDRFDLEFILLNNSKSFLANYLQENGTKVRELRYRGKKDMLLVWFKLLYILFKIKPKVIHTHLVDADLIGLSVGRVLGIPKRIYTRHNSNYNKLYHKGAEKFDKIANALCTHVVSISSNVSSILIHDEGVNKEKVRLIYHGFDLDKFQYVKEDVVNELKDKYNPLAKGPVIGVVSRYMHWKGVQYILPAFLSLLNDFPDALLILANAKKGDYAQEISEALSILPSGSYKEIDFENNLFGLYNLFDVFVHTPIDKEVEAFGQIYVEAMAAKVPSVVTLSGIAREYVKHNVNAIVVDYKNSDSIYRGIRTILNNSELSRHIVTNGLASVSSMFKLELMIDKLEKLYSE